MRHSKSNSGNFLTIGRKCLQLHRSVVGVSSCVSSSGDKERHIRDQVVFGTDNSIIRKKSLSENLELTELAKKSQGME